MIEGLTSAGLPFIFRTKEGHFCYRNDNGGKLASLSPSRYPVDPTQIGLCKEWIGSFCTPRKTVNKRFSSYRLKHLVERHYGTYISNGAFIAAANESGYAVIQKGDNSPNACFRFQVDRKVSA